MKRPMVRGEVELLRAIVTTQAARLLAGRKKFVGQEAAVFTTEIEGERGDILETDAAEGLFFLELIGSDGEGVWLTETGYDAAAARFPELLKASVYSRS